DENGRFYAPNTDDVGEAMENVIFQKLGKLEDLEEQIGMPLDVLLTLNHQDKIYIIDRDEEITETKFVNTNFDDIFLDVIGYSHVYMTDLKQYRKSWFLDKKEAEKKLEEKKSEAI
ncbi:hypothetical protein ACWG0P_13905, partial [Amedibacillus sp. YH-ame6]